ncbi:MAG: Sua5/YciO/YrdC/YwlC family protein [Pseudomonadota bacterium]|nr:Sua5/YciO/YrdC/YwlC family protein [Pseudomonadota bacterium]
MTVFNYEADAERVYDVLKQGGISVIPSHVGYVIVACDPEAIWRIFRAKKRKPEKLNAVCGCREMHLGLHDLPDDRRAIVTAITEEWDLPMGTAGKVHMDHPAIAGLPEDTLAQTTHEGTLAMLLNAGPLMDKIARLAFADNRMAIGSSANVSLQGVKFRATEIEPEILEAADIVIDYGLMRWNLYGHSSTMINVSDMTVIRYGSCFDLIEDLLRTHFDIELPPNPYDED